MNSPETMTLAVAVGASITLVELLRYAWALAACRREVREKSALAQIRDPYSRDLDKAKGDLSTVHDEGARAQIAGFLLRLLFLAAGIAWAMQLSTAGPGAKPLLEAIASNPLAFVPSFAALLAALRGFPSPHKKAEPKAKQG